MNTEFISYAAIVGMAIAPIYIGSWMSLDRVIPSSEPGKHTLSSRLASHLETDAFSSSEAYMFPLTGSVALLSLYLVYRYVGKEYINMLVAAYFAVFGVWVLTMILAQAVGPLEARFSLEKFELLIKKTPADNPSNPKSITTPEPSIATSPTPATQPSAESNNETTLVSVSFTMLTFFCFVVSLCNVIIYTLSKHWVLSNILGIAFSVSGIRLLALDSFKTGIILLVGLFFYDIFWVFGTSVMVEVAINLDAPIKLLFPRDIFAEVYKFAMLGLGDIVIPGVYIALCLRFDYYRHLLSQHKKNSSQKKSSASASRKATPSSMYSMNFPRPFFTACMVSYLGGLILTIIVMHTFKSAQPALLYLSPACILSTLAVAIKKRSVPELFRFSSDEDAKLKNLIAPDPNAEEKQRLADDKEVSSSHAKKAQQDSLAGPVAGAKQQPSGDSAARVKNQSSIKENGRGTPPAGCDGNLAVTGNIKTRSVSSNVNKETKSSSPAQPAFQSSPSSTSRSKKSAAEAETLGRSTSHSLTAAEASDTTGPGEEMMLVVSRKSRKRRAAVRSTAD